MDWSEEMRQFRTELDSLRLERARQIELEEDERRIAIAQMKDAFEALQVEGLLVDMNRYLLDQRGEVNVYLPWDIESQDEIDANQVDGEEYDETQDDSDVFSAVLTWDEEGVREVAANVGIGVDDLYLRVNGADIRMKDDALRKALLRAFQDELGL
jgi:hypothetical protein